MIDSGSENPPSQEEVEVDIEEYKKKRWGQLHEEAKKHYDDLAPFSNEAARELASKEQIREGLKLTAMGIVNLFSNLFKKRQ